MCSAFAAVVAQCPEGALRGIERPEGHLRGIAHPTGKATRPPNNHGCQEAPAPRHFNQRRVLRPKP